jgi:NAD(P)-dependent dehydrogenase (short-subunit alcohol dehydrogenase family)
MLVRIEGLSALVTGGASGLGLGTARHLVGRGARVVLLDLPSSEGEKAAAALGESARFVPADITDTEAVEAALDAASSHGPLRAVVHCAGRGGDRYRILSKDGAPGPLDAFAEVVRVNLIGTYNVLRLAAPRMSGNEPLDGERGAIAPGIMDTPMLARLRDDIREGLAASVPYPKRLGTSADYAQLAASIIENPYLNGEVIRLDGAIRMAPR